MTFRGMEFCFSSPSQTKSQNASITPSGSWNFPYIAASCSYSPINFPCSLLWYSREQKASHSASLDHSIHHCPNLSQWIQDLEPQLGKSKITFTAY